MIFGVNRRVFDTYSGSVWEVIVSKTEIQILTKLTRKFQVFGKSEDRSEEAEIGGF